MIHTIRDACHRLEATPYYRQLTRPQGGPGLWQRLVITVVIAAGALSSALLLRGLLPEAYTPAAMRLVIRLSVWSLLLTPTLAALVAAARTRAETRSQSFTLVGLATLPPAALVDSLAGAALHAMWPLWAATAAAAMLIGAPLASSIDRTVIMLEAAAAIALLAVLLNGMAVWFGVWAGVTAALRARSTLLKAVIDANANAFIGITIGVILAGGVAGVVYSLSAATVTLALRFLNAPASWVTTGMNLLAVAAVILGVGVLARIMRTIFEGVRLRAILAMHERT